MAVRTRKTFLRVRKSRLQRQQISDVLTEAVAYRRREEFGPELRTKAPYRNTKLRLTSRRQKMFLHATRTVSGFGGG
jgi:hypothetical protein